LVEKTAERGIHRFEVCPLPPDLDSPPHTHDQHTVHIILDGELIITDREGTRTFRPGDRVEFPGRDNP
jgi:mannose-6-phosphate isomerase-like protein (cupin superfamily)